MKRLIVALILVATAAQADHEHKWTTKTTSKTCCLPGQKEPNCTGTQTATYLVCGCGAERGQDSTACQ